jgi:hypothetical protein
MKHLLKPLGPFGLFTVSTLAGAALALAQPPGYPVYFNQNAPFFVIGQGLETWYTQGQGTQWVAVNTAGTGAVNNGVWISFVPPETGIATLSYDLTVGGENGWANCSVVNAAGTGVAGAAQYGLGSTSGSKPFGVAAGTTYKLSAQGSIYDPEQLFPIGGGTARATVTYPAPTTIKNTATRSNSGVGSGIVNAQQGTVSLGKFYAEPAPLDGGTISDVSFTVSTSNPYVTVFFDTGGATTTDANASIMAKTLAPPTVTSSPQSMTVSAGSPIEFSVVASGASPLAYQWFYNTSPMAGATGTSFSISNAFLPESGIYSVAVSNALGAVLSAPATLTVLPQPSISGIRPSGNNLVLTGSNGSPNTTFCVLMSTNVLVPIGLWTRVATNVFSTNSGFSITLSNSVTHSLNSRFYMIQQVAPGSGT